MVKSVAEMPIERFKELLDLCGPDLQSWPQKERCGALTLLDHSEIAKKHLQSDIALAELIKASPSPKPSPSLVSRIMAKARK